VTSHGPREGLGAGTGGTTAGSGGGRPDEENGRRLNAASARRIVPLRPELMRLGLLGFVKRQRAAGKTRLFPESVAAPGRRISDPCQKWCGRFLKEAGATVPRASLHSFRHGFRDALNEADVPGDRADELLGWMRENVRDGVYGSGTRGSTPAREAWKVEFPGLDLSRLDPGEPG
jgi:integrase